MDNRETRWRFEIKLWIAVIILGLFISGITAFPLETELAFFLENTKYFPNVVIEWLTLIHNALKETNETYPYLAYGTDWLAFAHLLLAILFIGPLRNPLKNKWIIEFGIICSVSLFPLALIAGNIREIPFFWQLIDCSFGAIALVPLCICLLKIKKIENINSYETYL